jgi:Radical SAM superfamily/4Fe-4S single cluster domain
MTTVSSPFALQAPRPIAPGKFRDPLHTAKGEPRAQVALAGLQTLWFNTGTLCNLACATCYIESSPRNDALVYLTLSEVETYLDEIARERLPTREIAFTGGEPFMNPDMIAILHLCLARGFEVLVLSNAMQPMRRLEAQLLALDGRERLTIRVSLDHYTREVHEAERGASWDKAIAGLAWLAEHDFRIAVAGRQLEDESEAAARSGYRDLFAQHALPIDAGDPGQLVLFPAMDSAADIAEISEACWGILGIDPAQMMCASSRMVVKRKHESAPRVVACTLLPYDPGFDLGASLVEASGAVALNHPHCARFCVLGGASCTA